MVKYCLFIYYINQCFWLCPRVGFMAVVGGSPLGWESFLFPKVFLSVVCRYHSFIPGCSGSGDFGIKRRCCSLLELGRKDTICCRNPDSWAQSSCRKWYHTLGKRKSRDNGTKKAFSYLYN